MHLHSKEKGTLKRSMEAHMSQEGGKEGRRGRREGGREGERKEGSKGGRQGGFQRIRKLELGLGSETRLQNWIPNQLKLESRK